jgi:hypothetical protein
MWYWLAEAHRRNDSPRDALRYVEDGLAHQPGNLALDRLKSLLLAELVESAADLRDQAKCFWRDKLTLESRDYETRSRLARLEAQTGNELAAWELLEECFDLTGVRPAVPLRTSGFPLGDCVIALEFLPRYAAFRKSAPVSDYWIRTDPLYDLPFDPPVSGNIQGALLTFLAIPFGLGLKSLKDIPPTRADKVVLTGFFDTLRPLVEHAITEAARELATLVPPKERGAEATADKVTEIIMFLGLVALREFAKQRGWLVGRLQVPTEAMNEAMNGYDEVRIEKDVMCGSLSRINKEVHFAPD